MIFKKTERLILRNVAIKDTDIMYDYRNNMICARYQRGQTKDYKGIVNLIEMRKNDKISMDRPFLLAIALQNTNEMIGEIVVMPDADGISLGYTISYKYHRLGYAFEALSALINMLHEQFRDCDFIGYTDPKNEPSMELLKKLGFKDRGYDADISSQVFRKSFV